jgi:carbonic anhydrase
MPRHYARRRSFVRSATSGADAPLAPVDVTAVVTAEEDAGVTTTDDLVANAERYARSFEPDHLSASPTRHLTVVSCMDARLDLFALLGLRIGDAHIVRNAGGIATDDVIRSLLLSQRALGTTEVMVIQHTGCGLHGLDEEAVLAAVEADAGARPPFRLEAFDDLDANVRRSVERIRDSGFVPHRGAVRGFVYEVEHGRLREVG